MESGSPLYSFSMCFFGFAVFGAGRGNFDAFFGDGKFHGVRALVGKLRDALDRIVQFAAFDHHCSCCCRAAARLRNSGIGRSACGKSAGVRRRGRIDGSRRARIRFRPSSPASVARRCISASAFLGTSGRTSRVRPSNLWSISATARRWPSVATMVTDFRLQQQQRAVQRVARFFIGNRKGCPARSGTTEFSPESSRARAGTRGSPGNYPWPFRPSCKSCGRPVICTQ